MSTEALKLAIIERVLRTEDEEILALFERLLKNADEEDPSDGHLSVVKERFEAYERGEGRNYSWDEAKALIRAGKGKGT